ncbi:MULTISPECIES: DUF5677 domain-containing protein [Paenibacillus]|jgi:hypothetical protein|uniref:DUF5677 domain-containing protein n=1 Tax=Paenibacillus TaxID=44249 RepID=UPI00096EE441|nr:MULTISPECIES: DUF5677 domain-containing protein [Paenibacillus]MBP1177420.1 hypothetical protein [Paenibacillus sp. PvR133]OMF34756.1 hypothetical protein BK134_05735 [Paenibacillus peoriae]
MFNTLNGFKETEEEFEKYLVRIRPLLNNYLDKNQLKHDEALYFCETYYFFLSFIADKGYFSKLDNSVKGIISKTMNDFFAILACLKAGTVYQAMILLRGLYESLLYLTFIYEDFDVRIRLYAENAIFERYKATLKEDHPYCEEELADLKNQYERIKNNYIPYKPWYYKLVEKIIQNDSENQKKGKKVNPSLKKIAELLGI